MVGGCDPMYRKTNEAKMILSTLPPWLKGIINAPVPEATHHAQTAPILEELWDLWEHCFHGYDPSRADDRWRALTPSVVKGQVTLIDLEDFSCSLATFVAFEQRDSPPGDPGAAPKQAPVH